MSSEKTSEERREEDLEQFRQLLVGEDLSLLNQLEQRVSDFESRVDDVSEVLPTAFQRLAGDPVLEAEIERPMLRTIHASIKRDTHAFAEYLFPVMGPAIRRAVADALKSLVQRINVAMENSFSAKGIRWRLEAARTGVPFTEIVLRHTMRYAVLETFLIARDTGLVLSHVHRDENLVLDEDAVAAMLTAIQSFIQDSLGVSADEALRSAELGDRTLWVINGPSALMACVISGTPPQSVRDELTALMEAIHDRYGTRFTEANDTLSEVMGLRALVHQSLREEVDDRPESRKRSKAPYYWAMAIALLLVFLGWKTWQENQQRELESQITNLFRGQPGYLVSSSHREESKLVIEGLRDPDSVPPDTMLAEQGFTRQAVQFRFKPFWSLEPTLVLQRLRSTVDLEDETGLELNNGTLHMQGVVSLSQAEALGKLTGSHPLIDSLDLSATRVTPAEALQMTREELGAPVSVELTPFDENIALSGNSDISWYLEASAVPRIIGGWTIDFEPLLADLQSAFRADAGELDGTALFFTRQDRLTDESETAIESLATQLQLLSESAGPLGIDMTITLVGEADGIGNLEQNTRVSRNRVRVVHDLFTGAGIDPKYLNDQYTLWNPGNRNLAKRRVTVRVTESDSK